MAAAIVDLDINEGETFLMATEFWEDVDNTIPVDISAWIWEGAFKIGTKFIPMGINVLPDVVNAIEITVDYSTMVELSSKGTYDIEALVGTEKFRVFQGAVRVSQEVTA